MSVCSSDGTLNTSDAVGLRRKPDFSGRGLRGTRQLGPHVEHQRCCRPVQDTKGSILGCVLGSCCFGSLLGPLQRSMLGKGRQGLPFMFIAVDHCVTLQMLSRCSGAHPANAANATGDLGLLPPSSASGCGPSDLSPPPHCGWNSAGIPSPRRGEKPPASPLGF